VFLAALFCEVKGLDPVGKYFLVRFVQCFGTADLEGLGVKAFAKQFGLTDRQVTKSLDALVECGVMSFSSISEGRGQPKRFYKFQDGFHKKFDKALASTTNPLPALLHGAAVGSLLKHENRKVAQISDKTERQKLDVAPLADVRSKRQSGQLSVVNRLLLSVLLCHADRFGVVSDLGFSALCKVTGLGKEDLKYRVQRLIHLGLIRAYVPGATSSVLFAKMKSVYFLNLNHPELSKGSDATSVLACPEGIHFAEGIRHASDIYKHVRLLRANPRSFDGMPYLQLVKFLEGQRDSFFRLLQIMLEQCAAQLLSRHWSALDRLVINKRIDDQELRDSISKYFRPSTLPSDSDDDQHDRLLDELYHGAYDLAVGIKEQLCHASDVPFESMDFIIIPRPLTFRYTPIALLALPKLPDAWRSCLVIKATAEGEAYPEPLSRESDISLEDRYHYGLQVQPRSEKATA
jgi:hypothetical protein